MLSGAVFALQQDMLKARGINMRRGGMLRDQIRSTLNTLYEIDDANLELLQQGVASQSGQSYQTHSVSARMRSTAARVWLLTTYATAAESFGTEPSSATMLNLGVGNLWMMLGVVGAERTAREREFLYR